MTRMAVVTGASRGLGEALARFLSGNGYSLVLAARGSDDLRTVADRLPGPVTTLAGDVADPGFRRRLVEAAGERIHLLVNNASELGPMLELASYRAERLRRVLEVNLVAPLALVGESLPALQRAHGLVVNVTSDAARGGYETWGGYGSSKAALELASLTLAAELRPRGVGVVTVDPGDMRTRMHQEAFAGQDISDRPLPDVTLPFWAWLIGRGALEVTGKRFEAQSDTWEIAA